MTGGKVEEFSMIWNAHKDEIKYQTSALLVKKIEDGIMKEDYEKGYREGLNSLPNLWMSCSKDIMNRKIEENKKLARIKKLNEESGTHNLI